MRVRFRDLAVFARDGAGGNPLAIVDHSAVSSDRWQDVARRIGYSETVFLESGDPPTVHIYTPGRRLPFAGHPLVGTAHILAPEVVAIRYDTGSASIRREHERTEVTVVSTGAVRQAAVPSFGVGAQVVEMPLEYFVVEVESPSVVSGLSAEDVSGHGEIYVWSWETPDESVRARFFAPDVGVEEDPATGSAAVALARAIGTDRGRLVIYQGEEVARPSRIELAWEGTSVTIGGEVIDRGEAWVELD